MNKQSYSNIYLRRRAVEQGPEGVDRVVRGVPVNPADVPNIPVEDLFFAQNHFNYMNDQLNKSFFLFKNAVTNYSFDLENERSMLFRILSRVISSQRTKQVLSPLQKVSDCM